MKSSIHYLIILCMYVCMCVCMCVCMYAVCMYTCMHAWISSQYRSSHVAHDDNLPPSNALPLEYQFLLDRTQKNKNRTYFLPLDVKHSSLNTRGHRATINNITIPLNMSEISLERGEEIVRKFWWEEGRRKKEVISNVLESGVALPGENSRSHWALIKTLLVRKRFSRTK